MKRLFKWIAVAVAVPVVLVALLIVLLYLPPFQDFAVQWASRYASEQTGYHIRVGRLRVTPLLDVGVDALTVCDAAGDTLVAAGRAVVDLALSQVLQRHIGI